MKLRTARREALLASVLVRSRFIKSPCKTALHCSNWLCAWPGAVVQSKKRDVIADKPRAERFSNITVSFLKSINDTVNPIAGFAKCMALVNHPQGWVEQAGMRARFSFSNHCKPEISSRPHIQRRSSWGRYLGTTCA